MNNSNLKPKEPRKVYLTFIDLDMRGNWEIIYDKYTLRSEGNGNEIWIVSPDGLKRAWVMKEGARITIFSSTISFDPAFIEDELAVDETEQQNRTLTKSWYGDDNE